MAVIATLGGRYRLARDETTALLRDLLGVNVSEGTVQAVCERVSAAVARPVAALEAAIPAAPQVFMDETGWKQGKVRHWLWTASTASFAVFAIQRRRSSAQVRSWLPEGPQGIVTSDRWSAYGHLDPSRRQLCWAHLNRDLQGLVDAAPGDFDTDLVRRGAFQMFHNWQLFKSGEIDRQQLKDAVSGFRGGLHRWATKAARSTEKGKRRGLAKDLLRLWPAVFQFIDREAIEPTNNQAERDLRPAVLWRKGSFGTRSDAGSRFVERMLSVWATCKRQDAALIDWVTTALHAGAGLRDPPSLLPA
jgi:transposase